MIITINGERKNFENNDLKLNELLEKLKLPDERIAVELNKQVVRKKDWQTLIVKENDKIEIVHFVGGG